MNLHLKFPIQSIDRIAGPSKYRDYKPSRVMTEEEIKKTFKQLV